MRIFFIFLCVGEVLAVNLKNLAANLLFDNNEEKRQTRRSSRPARSQLLFQVTGRCDELGVCSRCNSTEPVLIWSPNEFQSRALDLRQPCQQPKNNEYLINK